MPQLNKTNLVLMFVCTWISLHFIMTATKKINLSTTPTPDTTMHNPLSWYWPYT
uniref:ATPase 8 n=1 Tax=Xerotyphlops vermicularis TaxID=759976 RepID=A0A286S0V0_9SAUR|nr:ATPase 8 [Xerotyphlops vermicularis]